MPLKLGPSSVEGKPVFRNASHLSPFRHPAAQPRRAGLGARFRGIDQMLEEDAKRDIVCPKGIVSGIDELRATQERPVPARVCVERLEMIRRLVRGSQRVLRDCGRLKLRVPQEAFTQW